MTCGNAQERILDAGPRDAELSEHVAGCAACRDFLAVQRVLDQQLSRAYTAPALTPGFRSGLRARVRQEKQRQRWELLAPVVAPCAGLFTSGVCALLIPQMATFLLAVGLVLSVAGYAGQMLFVWLTEELGEG